MLKYVKNKNETTYNLINLFQVKFQGEFAFYCKGIKINQISIQ
jgi:hypothetical protein